MKRVLFVVPIVFLACSVTRPTSLPTPSPSAQRRIIYPALLVTDPAGHEQWVYQAWVERDTLRGRRTLEPPHERIAIPMSQVRAVAALHFSPGRTVALLGGGLAAVVVVAALMGRTPDYVVHPPVSVRLTPE